MLKRTLLLATCALAACNSSPAANSPAGHAVLNGKAIYDGETDSSGIVISLAGPTGGATVTDAAGHYAFGQLLPGSYAVVATATGALQSTAVATLSVTEGQTAAAADLHFTAVGTISGQAVAGGASNAGILVLVAGTSASAVTDDAGNFHLVNVPTGPHDLLATLSGRGSAKASSVLVKRGKDTAVPVLALAAQPIGTGSISGKVFLSGQPAPAGLALAVQGPIAAAAITGDAGAYSFQNLPDGQYVVTAVVRSTDAAAQTLAVQIQSGEAHPSADFHLTSLGIVRGKATFGTQTAGNAGITVAVVGSLAVGIADDAGNFELFGVPSGAQDVLATYPGFRAASVAVTVTWDAEANASPLVLGSLPAPSGSVSGKATLVSAADMSGTLVTATGPSAAGTTTDADGTYTLAGLADGEYVINATSNNTAERVESLSVVIEGGRPITGQNFSFTPVGSIDGFATVNGAPAAGVLVYALGTRSSALTDVAGYYRLLDLPAGNPYTVQGTSLGFLSQQVTVANVARGERATADGLVLIAHGSQVDLGSTVSFFGLGPAVGASVSANGPDHQTTTADSAGAYDFNVQAGMYSISFSSGLYQETIPYVAALAGGHGFIWDRTTLPLAPFELQYGKRVGNIYSPNGGSNTFNYQDPNGDALAVLGITCFSSCIGRGFFFTGGGGSEVPESDVMPGAGRLGPNHSATYLTSFDQNTNLATLHLVRADGTTQVLGTNANPYGTLAIGGGRIAFLTDVTHGRSGTLGTLRTLDTSTTSPSAVVSTRASDSFYILSPDGAFVWYGALGPSDAAQVEVAPAAGCAGAAGCPVVLSAASSLNFSTDGQVAWYQDSTGALTLSKADGTGATVVDPNATQFVAHHPAVGPDVLLYQVGGEGGISEYLVTLTVGAQKPVLLATAAQIQPAFGSSTVVLTTGAGEIHAATLVNPAPRKLSSTAVDLAMQGDLIAFVDAKGQLSTASLVSGPAVVVEPSSVAWYRLTPGGHLLFSTDKQLSIAQANGSGVFVLLPSPIANGSASLSLDEKQVLAVDGKNALYVGTITAQPPVVASNVAKADFFADGSILSMVGTSSPFKLAIRDAGSGTFRQVADSVLGYAGPPNTKGFAVFAGSGNPLTIATVGASSTALAVLSTNASNFTPSRDFSRLFVVDGQTYDPVSGPHGSLIVALVDGSPAIPALGLANTSVLNWIGPTSILALRVGSPAPYEFQDAPYVVQVAPPGIR